MATLAPVVTASTADLAANATLTISGYGFDTNTANDSVTFNNVDRHRDQSPAWHQLTVSVSGLSTLTADTDLEASVTVDRRHNGGPVQVAALTPPWSPASTAQTWRPTLPRWTISRLWLLTVIPANDSVTFDNDVTGTVTSGWLDHLTVSISGLSSLTAGTVLEASVTVDLVSNGSLVQVATIEPVVTLSLAYLPANATALTINGNGFDTNAANDSVTFDNHVTGIVTAGLDGLTSQPHQPEQPEGKHRPECQRYRGRHYRRQRQRRAGGHYCSCGHSEYGQSAGQRYRTYHLRLWLRQQSGK